MNLVDMNDNLPVFDKEEYRVTIRENIAPGTKVLQVSWRDMTTMMTEHSKHCQSADLIQYLCWTPNTKRSKVAK